MIVHLHNTHFTHNTLMYMFIQVTHTQNIFSGKFTFWTKDQFGEKDLENFLQYNFEQIIF